MLFNFEKDYFNKGFNLIAGIDEAGRGPLAGPLVAAAVIFDKDKLQEANKVFLEHRNNDVSSSKIGLTNDSNFYSQINDSKKLTASKRATLYNLILKNCVSYHIAVIESEEIDKVGIATANSNAFNNALNGLRIKPDFVFTDHFELKLITKEHQLNITKGDAQSVSIAAASILAKVYRDSIMCELDKTYPQYAFSTHKGYGTKDHIIKINEFGPCEIHRKSFEPIKSMLKYSSHA